MFHKLYEIAADKRAAREDGEGGFTLIELLVVVVIIGILVAIAIPLYLNYRQGAQNKGAESDIRNAAPLVEQYYADNQAYPATDAVFQGLSGLHKSSGDTLTYTVNAGGTKYCIEGVNSSGGVTYGYSNDSGTVAAGTCSAGVFTPAS